MLNAFARDGVEDDHFSDYLGSLQSIITSSAQNESKLFETNLRDERYLPFVNSGVVSVTVKTADQFPARKIHCRSATTRSAISFCTSATPRPMAEACCAKKQ